MVIAMSDNILSFTVFVIHALAKAWMKTPAFVYSVLNESQVLDGYVISSYDMLHTMGRKALIEDITDFVKEKGFAISECMSEEIKAELAALYKENLEASIIKYLAERKKIDIRDAMNLYYSSRLAEQIEKGEYGIENLDYKYLAEDLLVNG